MAGTTYRAFGGTSEAPSDRVVGKFPVVGTDHCRSLGMGVDGLDVVKGHSVRSIEVAQEVPGFDDGSNPITYNLSGFTVIEFDPSRGGGVDHVFFVASKKFTLSSRFSGGTDGVVARRGGF